MLLKAYEKTRAALTAAKARLAGLGKDESGAGMIEYALLAALIGVFLVGTITTMRGNIDTTFDTVSQKLSTANSASSS